MPADGRWDLIFLPSTFIILMKACNKIRVGFGVLMAVKVRLAECGEVTLHMEVRGPSELPAGTYTVFVH